MLSLRQRRTVSVRNKAGSPVHVAQAASLELAAATAQPTTPASNESF